MKKNVLVLFVVFFSVLMFYGCGGSDGSAGADGTPIYINSNAYDGPIQDLRVFLDEDGDWSYDPDTEASAFTDENGRVRIPHGEDETGNQVSDINDEGYDVSVGITAHYLLAAPQGYDFITPVTTLVARGMSVAETLTFFGLDAGIDLSSTNPMDNLPLYKAGAIGQMLYSFFNQISGQSQADTQVAITEGEIPNLDSGAIRAYLGMIELDKPHRNAFATVVSDGFNAIKNCSSHEEVFDAQKVLYTEVQDALKAYDAGTLSSVDLLEGYSGAGLEAKIQAEQGDGLVAEAGEDQEYTVSEGETSVIAEFDGSISAGGISSYTWSVYDSDGNFLYDVTGPHPTAELSAGTYEVQLQVSNEAGDVTATDSLVVTVNSPEIPNPSPESPVADAGGDITVEDSDGDGVEVVQFDGSASNDPDGDNEELTHEWGIEGQFSVNGLAAAAELAVGTYTVNYTVTDEQGMEDTQTFEVVVSEQEGGNASGESDQVSLDLNDNTLVFSEEVELVGDFMDSEWTRPGEEVASYDVSGLADGVYYFGGYDLSSGDMLPYWEPGFEEFRVENQTGDGYVLAITVQDGVAMPGIVE